MAVAKPPVQQPSSELLLRRGQDRQRGRGHSSIRARAAGSRERSSIWDVADTTLGGQWASVGMQKEVSIFGLEEVKRGGASS